MTGTAKTEEQEFQAIYDLDVVEIPTNKPQHALQIVADWMEPAYGFHSLFNFKRKFQPAEAPVYVCYPDPAALPQIGLAVVRAYVPSVTPAEVAGMLSTLRS